MRSLLRYVLKNYAFLLFLLLEVFSFVLIFNYNTYQKSKYLNSSNSVTASIYNSYNSIIKYFGLSAVNRELSEENAKLRSLLNNVGNISSDSIAFSIEHQDSLYKFISARVINNSVNKQYNYITLNKGRKDGIKPDQGIVNANGVVGVITNVSESYSVGFSVLNKRWGVSAKLKDNGTFGPLSWDGNDFRYANLNGIPFHVELTIGDTVVTSSYSSVFPEGYLIGTVSSFEQPQGENYYIINVKLAVDFKSLSYVEVIDNLKRKEIKDLENLKIDDSVSN